MPAARLANGRPRDQWRHMCPAKGHQAAPDCPVWHGTRGWKRSASPYKEGNRIMFTVSGAPDFLVRPRIEGNLGLPNGSPAAPKFLGEIKGPLGAWSTTPSIH
jgi:hypothetical protein